MTDLQSDAKAIFVAALDCQSPAEVAAYLEQACAGDAALRDRIEELLRAHQDAGSFLDCAALRPPPTLVQLVTERPGAIVGPYKLLEQIGEGGMGVVFMAEQTQPVQRKVAIKIIKPGMDTKQVIARFEAERQALALMDHPNIARVLDAGATESARPYFAMELVRGVPVTEYCDKNRISIRERLKLFISICQAVQHAHQKGIIHRDLKPTNVLVTLHDGRPVVKVIDFGVAKATGQKLTEKTLFTGFAQLIGTPLYMSPEQAEMSGLDVDTRSDIYSLGVILYELLTGSTPFDSQRLKEVAFDELRRIIREEEPRRPSTLLSTLAQQAISIVSEKRSSDPRQLSRLFQGELDWIVMKCLEKDRNRRYEMATALAADVARYLANEPVQACPPSRIYRCRKFAWRYRAALVTASLLVVALVAGIAVSAWQAVRATQAERQALENAHRADAVSDYMLSAFGRLNPHSDGRAITVAEVLDQSVKDLKEKFADDPRTKAAILRSIGLTYNSLDLYQAAIPLFEEARALRLRALGPDHPDTLKSLQELATVYWAVKRFDDLRPIAEELVTRQTASLGPNDPETLYSTIKLAFAYRQAGRADEGRALIEHALALLRESLGSEDPHTINAMSRLAQFDILSGRTDEAISLYNEAIKYGKVDLNKNFFITALSMDFLADLYQQSKRYDEAISLREDLLQMKKNRYGPAHQRTLDGMSNLAEVYQIVGQTDEAKKLSIEAVNLGIGRSESDRSGSARLMNDLGGLLHKLNAEETAEKAFREVVRLAPENWNGHANLGLTLARQAQADGKDTLWDKAAAEFVRAMELATDNPYHGTRLVLAGTVANWEELFKRVSTLRPDDPTLWIGRAKFRAARSRWPEALADYQKAIHQRPSAGDEMTDYAYLLVMLNDTEGFQQFCRELMARPSEPHDAVTCFQMARAMAAAPFDAVDPKLLVEWASTAISKEPDRNRDGAWLHCLGLAQYRAGQFDDAIDTLKNSNSTSWYEAAKSQNWVVLAMAHNRIRQADEAHHCLETARNLIDAARPKNPDDRVQMPVEDWIPALVLLREAEASISVPTSNSKAKPEN